MKRPASILFHAVLPLIVTLAGCGHAPPKADVTLLIESSPANLDPRVGTDAQSERIYELIFDSLVKRDEHFNLVPSLAERWEIPDPTTYIFHLRHGVRFHDGRPLGARDVAWTVDSMSNGTLMTSKTTVFADVERVEVRSEDTVVFHLKEPDASLLWNLSDGAFGVVPYGSGKDFNLHPIGSGPFRFVSQRPDEDVLLARNDDYWQTPPRIASVRFAVVPDETTRALELRKGSADVEIGALSADLVRSLERDDPKVTVQQSSGTNLTYLAFNLRDPVLKDVRVRQAIAYAIEREPIIHYLWRDTVRPAESVLPPQQWAYTGDVQKYPHDVAKANQILEAAGYHRQADGYRLHLTMKTSTEETTRLLAAILQQQLREAGIRLDIKSQEFALFYSDVTKGAFQMYSMRWIGANQDPDFFEHVFSSASFPPKRANRGYYSNPEVDKLIEEGRTEIDQTKRRAAYVQVQQILAQDLPYIDLWYVDNVLVHGPRLQDATVSAAGNYDFLATVGLR